MSYTIVGRDNCPWCDKAKDLLKYADFKYFDVSEAKDLRKFLTALGFKTVPQVWHGDIHIGGYENLANYLGASCTGYGSPLVLV